MTLSGKSLSQECNHQPQQFLKLSNSVCSLHRLSEDHLLNGQAAYLKIFKILQDSLQKGQLVTRRDIFYRDVALFKTQRVVDECVKQLCDSLELTELEIGAIASPKGLICGDLEIFNSNGSMYKISSQLGPQLIPIVSPSTTITFSESIKYVLVVEKEAIFKRLCNSYNDKHNSRVLLCGKGFPDRSTKDLVTLLSQKCNSIPIYCLVDSDIYGLLIFLDYLYPKDSKLSTGIIHLGMCLLDHRSGFLDISARDFIVLRNFLNRISDIKHLEKIKLEAQRGIFMLKKTEMNVFDNVDCSVESLLECYISQHVKI